MLDSFQIPRAEWHNTLLNLSDLYHIYLPVKNQNSIEYELITHSNHSEFIYNTPKPVSPLKAFFLPVKENVVIEKKNHKKKIIAGIPSCDLHGLNLLDEIYLNFDYQDPYYKHNRDNSILIGTDCFSAREHCHCTSYGIQPYPEVNHDISMAQLDDSMYVFVHSEKGKEITGHIKEMTKTTAVQKQVLSRIQEKREAVTQQLKAANHLLPDYARTGELIQKAAGEIWEKHSKTCVSCGACSAICPTCSCFLLVDRPEFEKIRQLDTCQYPGFERIAAGEDPLGAKPVRFKNRYFCKYVWKPGTFNSLACTGCGRCIESCIGNINKNELFLELNGKE